MTSMQTSHFCVRTFLCTSKNVPSPRSDAQALSFWISDIHNNPFSFSERVSEQLIVITMGAV